MCHVLLAVPSTFSNVLRYSYCQTPHNIPPYVYRYIQYYLNLWGVESQAHLVYVTSYFTYIPVYMSYNNINTKLTL